MWVLCDRVLGLRCLPSGAGGLFSSKVADHATGVCGRGPDVGFFVWRWSPRQRDEFARDNLSYVVLFLRGFVAPRLAWLFLPRWHKLRRYAVHLFVLAMLHLVQLDDFCRNGLGVASAGGGGGGVGGDLVGSGGVNGEV